MLFSGNITHGTAHMFAAKSVYLKSTYLDDEQLSASYYTLARRIACLRNDDLDLFLPINMPDLYKGQ